MAAVVPQICVVQRGLFGHEEPRLNCRCPYDLDALGHSGPKIKCPLVGAEVVQDEVDFAFFAEARQDAILLQEGQYNFASLFRTGNAEANPA
jgi:hypothetical protein